MREPTCLTDGEGRRWSSRERQRSTGPARGVAMAWVQGESTGNTGSPSGGTTVFPTGRPRGPGRAAEGWRTGSEYRGSRVMPVEGRDLTSGALWKRPTAGGLTARSSNPKPTVERSRKELYGPTKGAPSGVPVGRSVKPVGEP